MDRRKSNAGRGTGLGRAGGNALRGFALAVTIATATGLSGCAESYQHGYIAPDNAVDQVQVGASREQVLLILGSPSTTATIGGEAFYYITQKAKRSVAFLHQAVYEQKVIAVYFDEKAQVKEVAHYGLEDGKVFDYISRKTKTTGADYGLLSQILKANPANPLTSNQ
ncbi:outer membrane protein assembly factor BamE [Pinisolibacter sp.]|uniref:outer membrane protein assembly factor BamE n=1 Tax=Pinisolibacter sp. TaxID=2172024 RepID=UPI002FDD70AD